MIRRSRGHAVVEVMNIDREIRAAFSKLVDAMAFHNNDEIDIEKARMQFKKISDRVIRDFEEDMLAFPAHGDSERTVERRIYTHN
jgi:fructose/tagatose bisphosphate aldolase